MLPKINRLNLAHLANQTIFAFPDRQFFSRFWMIKVKLNQVDRPRIAVVIPKKKMPLAVNRNRLKRLAYQLIATLITDWPAIDGLIVLKQSADNSTTLMTDLYQALIKIKS